MPAIRPDAPAQVPQYGSNEHKDELAQRIMEHILGQLDAPMPQAPKAPTPQPLGWAQAAAAAMNPEFINYFQQQANAPGQAAYQQSQNMFEAAMQGRREALTAGTQLLGRDITGQYSLLRPSAASRGQVKESTITGDAARALGVDPSKSWRIRQVFDPITRAFSDPEVIGEVPYSPVVMPGVFDGNPGVGVVSRSGSAAGSARQIPGMQPTPPEGTVTSIAGDVSNLAGLSDVWDSWRELKGKTEGAGSLTDRFGQVVGTALGESKYGGWLAPEYAKFVANAKTSLNRYIKQQTGAQFSITEMNRYDAMWPKAWDAPDVAKEKIQKLQEQALIDMRSRLGSHPGAGPAAAGVRTPNIGPMSGKMLKASDFNKIADPAKRQSEMQRFRADGGVIIEGQ